MNILATNTKTDNRKFELVKDKEEFLHDLYNYLPNLMNYLWDNPKIVSFVLQNSEIKDIKNHLAPLFVNNFYGNILSSYFVEDNLIYVLTKLLKEEIDKLNSPDEYDKFLNNSPCGCLLEEFRKKIDIKKYLKTIICDSIKDLEEENSNNNISLNDIKTKYKILIKNVLKIMNEENSLLNDNIIFKKFYYSQQLIRISEISCPDIILNDEYLDDNGSFAFSIEAKAPENIIYTMSNKFYSNLRNKNISVKINQGKLLYKKINLMLQRLLIIRNSMINSFFDSKTQKEIGALVIRELNDVISAQLLKRRSLIKKDEIILSSNDNENK